MWSSPLIWIVIAIVLFWAVGAHNRLVRLRSAVVQAFGSLDAHLVRWLAMLGEFDAAQATAGTLDREARSTLQGATTQLTASLAVVRAYPLQGDAVAALSAACGVLDAVWPNLQPGGDPGDALRKMAPWRVRWDELRNHNEQAARIFNEAVLHYNTAIGQFPAVLLAWVFGFSPARALSIAREGNS
jgi:LemA protein